MIDEIDLVARLGVALACGLALGAEREARSKVAGVRTHALVAVGAALFTISGAYGIDGISDPTRVAAQVASGIGFIGAGAIMRSGFNITGVTTASTVSHLSNSRSYVDRSTGQPSTTPTRPCSARRRRTPPPTTSRLDRHPRHAPAMA